MRLPDAIQDLICPGEGGCWLWTGSLNPDGYGQIELAGRKHWLAHRLVWHLLGGTLPENLHHRPTCPKRCVNPDHLEPMTAAEHAHRHLREVCDAGHPMVGDNVYYRPDGGRQCRRCKADRQRARYARDPATENAARTERRRRTRREVDVALTD